MSLTEDQLPMAGYRPAHWLQALRFHLTPTPAGEYCFSHVHLNDSSALTRRESFLRDLMTGRTIDEVLHDLTPLESKAGIDTRDSTTAVELRAYFQELARVLHLHTAAAARPQPSSSLAGVDTHGGAAGIFGDAI